MRIHVAEAPLDYDGSQLHSHFALRRFGVEGDAVVVFKGAMDVAREHTADLEDLLAGTPIRSAWMLHLIVECFHTSLTAMVLRQRLLARIAADLLHREWNVEVRVKGDDLYVGEGKLSVSIAAPSPVSCLIHFGLNISTRKVPVTAAGLEELGVDPDRLGPALARAFAEELASVEAARCKVRGVP